MSEAGALLAAFLEATGRQAAIWEKRDAPGTASLVGASSDEFAVRTASAVHAWDVNQWARTNGLVAHLIATGESVGWLITEPARIAASVEVAGSSTIGEADSSSDADRFLGRVLPLLARIVRERDGATKELSGRYEEISLLYAIGELLGGTTSVESVADSVLAELASTMGADRAVFLQTDRQQGRLCPIAGIGLPDDTYDPVSLENLEHIAVRAFNSGSACTEDGSAAALADPVLAGDGASLMAVAIMRPSTGMGITGSFPIPSKRAADGVSVPMGVFVLARKRSATAFSDGARKLAVAIGTQVGVAMHNASLVRTAIERQQLAHELALAHELQLKLLPDPSVVRPEARAAARVVSAETVGGDFYLLARLDHDHTGVLIGDVSGHGYQSALVMALALSAAAIHMQAAFDPSVAIEAVQRSLRDELMSTEMSISLCYAVIDSRANEIRFVNAGHPHAFRLSAKGEVVRLPAAAPPLGFLDEPVEEYVMSWRADDRLVLFTDGLPDARNRQGQRLGESAVLNELSKVEPHETPDIIIDRLANLLVRQAGGLPLQDDCTMVVVDRIQ